MKQQNTLMKFDPATGEPKPYPSHAAQWRDWHGKKTAWIFNPWTGTRREAPDVGSDTFGLLILPPDEPRHTACCIDGNRAGLLAEDIEVLHLNLDEAGIPRSDGHGNTFSLWGRVMLFKSATSNAKLKGGST